MPTASALEDKLIAKYGGGKSRDELKERQAKLMYEAAKAWATRHGLNFTDKPSEKLIRYGITASTEAESYRLIVKATKHHCIFATSWEKNLLESQRPPFSVLATAFNHKVKFKLVTLDMDVRDGEVRFRATIPMGVMAPNPSAMVSQYIKMLSIVTRGALTAMVKLEDMLKDPIAAGHKLAETADALLAAHLHP